MLKFQMMNQKSVLSLVGATVVLAVSVFVGQACTGLSASPGINSASSASSSTDSGARGPNTGTTGGGATLPAPIAGMNYVMTFDDEFTNPNDISAGSTYVSGTNWYNGTDQCCMDGFTNNGQLHPGDAGYDGRSGAMYPSVVNGTSWNPYSYVPGGGLDITLKLIDNTFFSGIMTSVDRTGKGFSQQYGYFEFRAKLPAGPGTWPSFWMLSLNDIQNTSGLNGEMDIFEQYSSASNTAFCTTYDNHTDGTYWQDCNNPNVPDLTADFHTFGFLWTATTTTVYLDGVQMNQTATLDSMKQPYYMLVDLGWGGQWPTLNTPATNVMQIQWIRAYQQQ